MRNAQTGQAELLEAALKRRNLSNRQLALKLGVSHPTVSGWASGEHAVQEKWIKALAEELDIDEWELLTASLATRRYQELIRNLRHVKKAGEDLNIPTNELLGVRARRILESQGESPEGWKELVPNLGILSEEITWRYRVGACSSEDTVMKFHSHKTGGLGLGLISWTIGQMSVPAFDLGGATLRERLSLKAEGRSARLGALELDPLVVSVEGEKVIVEVVFPDGLTNDTVRWTVSWNWPGLWDRLRSTGKDTGRIKLRRPRDKTSIQVVADAGVLSSVTIHPRDHYGHVATIAEDNGRHGTEWCFMGPRTERGRTFPIELRYDVLSTA